MNLERLEISDNENVIAPGLPIDWKIRCDEEVNRICNIIIQNLSNVSEFEISILKSKIKNYSDIFCEKCFYTGESFNIQNGEFISGMCECKKNYNKWYKYTLKLKKFCIPLKYHYGDFSTDYINIGRTEKEKEVNAQSFETYLKYCNELDKWRQKGYGLFITGNNYVGKTFLACDILKRAIWKLYVAYYTTIPELIKLTFSNKSKINTLKECDFLLIDDFRIISPIKSGYDLSIVHDVLSSRSSNLKPTLLTSNVTLSDIHTFFDESIQSIIQRSCVEITLLGESFAKGVTLD